MTGYDRAAPQVTRLRATMVHVRRPAVLVAILLVGASCGRAAAATTTTLRVRTFDLGADRYRLEAPSTVRAGVVRVEFTNLGRIPHDAQLVRVDGAHSLAEVADTIHDDGSPTPAWLHDQGGVGTLTQGQTATATVALTAGSYYIIDSGLDEDSIPFAKAGAAHPLQVVGTEAQLPGAQTLVSEREYSFAIGRLRAGSTAIRVDNVGQQPHELLAAPIVAGETLDDVRQAFGSPTDAQRAFPVDLAKAVSVSRLDPGRSLVATLHLGRGTYAFVCLVSDREGGPRHVALGMIAEATVG